MAIKECPKCQEFNSPSAAICTFCGESLRSTPVTGEEQDEKNYETFRSTRRPERCSYCSQELKPGALKCGYCGTVNTRTERKPVVQTSGGGPDGCGIFLLFGATLIIPLVGLIVGGIYIFNDDPDKQGWGKGLLVFGLIVIVLWIFLGSV